MPQMSACIRIDPARSLPSPAGDMQVEIATASPPLDPPGVRFGLWGWFVLPKTGLSAV
jgi:hypothetical protein